MSDGTFVNALRDAVGRPGEIADHHGRKVILLPPGWATKFSEGPTPVPLEVSTLSAIRTYCEAAGDTGDSVAATDLLLVVDDPTSVRVVQTVDSDAASQFKRHVWMRARPLDVDLFEFGRYMDPETFTIALLSQFAPTSDRDALVRMVGSIVDGGDVQFDDDGLTQTVRTRNGAAFVKDERVPNPITLAPYRTFPEVEQPEGTFILRLKSGAKDGAPPSLALFIADGGRWRVTAAASIASWLKENVPTIPVVA